MGFEDAFREPALREQGARMQAARRESERSTAERSLAERDQELRHAVLRRFAELARRYRRDALMAVDWRGTILEATAAAPMLLHAEAGTPDALRAAIAAHVRAATRDAYVNEREVAHADLLEHTTDEVLLAGHLLGVSATSFPVFDGLRAIGSCLLLRSVRPARGTRATCIVPAMPHAVPLADSPVQRSLQARASGKPRDRPRVLKPHDAASGHAHAAIGDLVGADHRIVLARDAAVGASRLETPVLLLGESGTGKSLLAEAIHGASARRLQRLVVVQCAAIAAGRRTPATDAEDALHDLLRDANGGTLLLEDIGSLAQSAQAALLRVLASRSGEPSLVGPRVIATSTRSVDELLISGALRRDLHRRLSVTTITLPPLRAREDLALLARHFLDRASVDVGRPGLSFAPAVVDVLLRNPWPGNARELRDAIRRIASLSVGSCITIGQLPPALLARRRTDRDAPGGTAADRSASDRSAADRSASDRETALPGVASADVADARVPGSSARGRPAVRSNRATQ